MNERKLTEEQIRELFSFCEENDVKYYDVQVELVDHLATAIENRWGQRPELTFQQNLNETYREFGYVDFLEIQIAKRKELSKKYKRLLWQYFGQFFKLPKIILTFLFSFLLFVIFRSTDSDSIIVINFLAIVIVFLIAYFAYIFPKYYKIKENHQRKFLIADVLKNIQAELATLPVLLFNTLILIRNSIKPSFNCWVEAFVSFLIISSLFFIVSFYFYVPKKVRNSYKEQFPQFIKA